MRRLCAHHESINGVFLDFHSNLLNGIRLQKFQGTVEDPKRQLFFRNLKIDVKKRALNDLKNLQAR
jgi:hypothetical protein